MHISSKTNFPICGIYTRIDAFYENVSVEVIRVNAVSKLKKQEINY